MRRFLLALATVLGLESTSTLQEPAAPDMPGAATPSVSHFLAMRRYYHQHSPFSVRQPKIPNIYDSIESEIGKRESDIERAAQELFDRYQCQRDGQELSPQVLHQELQSIAIDLHYSIGEGASLRVARQQMELLLADPLYFEDSHPSALDQLVQARYVERCVDNGQGLVDVYRAHHEAMAADDCENAVYIADTIDNALLQFDTRITCDGPEQEAAVYRAFTQEYGMQKVMLRMNLEELSESARLVSPSFVSEWMENCIDNRSRFQLFWYNYWELEGECIADLVRADHFGMQLYNPAEILRHFPQDSRSDLEVRCQLQTFLFFEGKIAAQERTYYEYREGCLRTLLKL